MYEAPINLGAFAFAKKTPMTMGLGCYYEYDLIL
jgi:hypothetical protein